MSKNLRGAEPWLALGAGLSIPFSAGGIHLGLRYQWGIFNPIEDIQYDLGSRNLMFQLGLSFGSTDSPHEGPLAQTAYPSGGDTVDLPSQK